MREAEKQKGQAMKPGSNDLRPIAVVLGAAHWHAPLYTDRLASRFRVAAVQDATLAVAERFASPLDASATTDVTVALDDEDIDVAFVFSPHHQMLEVARKLIDRRIPFVIEKPAGIDLGELKDLDAEARRADVAATVALVQRGAPIDAWLRQAGDVFYERMAFIAGPANRYRQNGNPWMLDPTLSGGGSLMNLGPHFVDMALRHIGTPSEIVRRQSTVMHGEVVDDHATLVLRTRSGREAIVEVGYAFPDSPLKRYCSFTSAGTRGFASIDTSGNATFTDTSGKTKTATLEVDSDPLYGRLVDEVADTLDSGFSGMSTLADLLATMELIWAPEKDVTVTHD